MTWIEKLQLLQVPKIAKIHKLYLKDGILAKLDESFLIDFYKSTIDQKNIFTAVATDGSQVLGYATGAVNVGAIPRVIVPKIIKSLLLAIIKDPRSIFYVMQIPFYPGFRANSKSAEIFSLAVLPQFQGKGVGRSLVDYCKKEFKKRGCNDFVVSVRSDMRANLFYKKIGLEKVKSSKFLGDTINFWQGPC